jgi:serine/threonine-protein kinase
MIMRFVPGGESKQGGSDEDAPEDQKPQHTVSLKPFWIDQTEVTHAQYRLCVEAAACVPPIKRAYFDDPARATHPVVLVNWEEADAYCRWLAAQTKWDVRLPTEAQWEKAASWDPATKTQRPYPWGAQDPDPKLLNYLGAYKNSTAPVGAYPAGASAYGALDMAGNVWEWAADWYDRNYYKTADAARADPSGPATGTARVMRGGSYGYGSAEARATYRTGGDPKTSRGEGLGFRCAVMGERLP